MKVKFNTEQDLNNFLTDITQNCDVNWNNDTKIENTEFTSSNLRNTNSTRNSIKEHNGKIVK